MGLTGYLGCLTCRKRKIKCDEAPSKCKQCIKHGFSCEWPDKALQAISRPPPRRLNERSFPASRKLSIRPALSDRHIACANSLYFSKNDRVFLEYFPSSTIYCFYDFFEWGALQYLVKVTAPRSRLVTKMILALSATEMHRHSFKYGLTQPNDKSDEGLIHYTHGLQELMKEISNSNQGDSIDAKLAALVFMVHYELQFTGSLHRIQIHLQGFLALIKDHPFFGKRPVDHTRSPASLEEVSDPGLAISCQLIGWALLV